MSIEDKFSLIGKSIISTEKSSGLLKDGTYERIVAKVIGVK